MRITRFAPAGNGRGRDPSSQLSAPIPMRLVVVPTRPAPCIQVSSETCDMIVLICKTLSRFSNSSDNNRILLTRLL